MLTYLAQPYTHADALVRKLRLDAARHVTAELMRSPGLPVFSPIVHGCGVEGRLPEGLRTSHKFWMQQCIGILRHCEQMVILPLTGWRESKGLAEELALAKLLDIETIFICEWDSPPGDSPWLQLDPLTKAEFAANPSWGYGHV